MKWPWCWSTLPRDGNLDGTNPLIWSILPLLRLLGPPLPLVSAVWPSSLCSTWIFCLFISFTCLGLALQCKLWEHARGCCHSGDYSAYLGCHRLNAFGSACIVEWVSDHKWNLVVSVLSIMLMDLGWESTLRTENRCLTATCLPCLKKQSDSIK